IQPCDEINVVILMRKRGWRSGSVSVEIGIIDSSGSLYRLARHLAIEKCELGIDAGDGSVLTRRSGNPERNSLCKHDIQDWILRKVARQPISNRRFDLTLIIRPFDAFSWVES